LIWADLLVCVTWEKEVASEGPIRERGGAYNEKNQSESEEELAMKRAYQRAGRLHLKGPGGDSHGYTYWLLGYSLVALI